MKIKTEITTRNWNNAWVDVNLRLPSKDTECFVLWRARTIHYDPKSMKSDYVVNEKGMGYADFIDGNWKYSSLIQDVESDWSQCTDEFDWYIKEPLDNHNYDRGTSGDYEIIDSDVFENDPNRIYVLSKDKYKKPYRVTSMEVEILAWCSIPNDPINPFKGE